MKKTVVKDLVDHFQFQVASGKRGLMREITVSDVIRPGLAIAGYFNYHPTERIHVLGKSELSFFETLPPEVRKERMLMLCSEPDTPCICVTRNLPVPEELISASEQMGIPVLRSQTNMSTTRLISKMINFLEERIAPSTTLHGVLVDVYGVGVLIMGNSGMGKSETALELLKRGHRLVADDAVEIRQTQENQLIGNAPPLIQHLLEIRGVGIINAMTLFGAGAVRNYKKITLVIRMELWDENKQYDRLGLEEEKFKILDTELPLITIPVRPGRNLAIIIEVAAMNYRLKRLGYNAAVQFSKKLNEMIDEADEF